MWDLAVREEDFEAADSMLRRYHGSAPLSMRLLSAFVREDSTARQHALEEARGADNRQPQIAARFFATYREDYATAEQLARLSLAPGRRPALRAGAQQLLAWLAVARGRWSGARTSFAAAEGIEGASPPVSLALAATLPFLPVPAADRAAAREEIRRWSPTNGTPEGGLPLALAPHLRLYLLGLLSSGLGDAAAASRTVAELERIPAPPEAREAVRALAQAIRADLAWRSGRWAEALAALETIQGAVPLEFVDLPLYATVRAYTQEPARYLRAEVLHRLGRDADALRWLQASFQGAPNEFVFLAPAHLLQAEIYQRLGDRVKAAEHYRRAINLWQDCDPELRPRLQQARARLAEIRGSSPRGS